MSEQERLAHAAAQDRAQPSSSALAHADQQARLAHDEAQLRTGGPHSDEIMSYHEGRPTVREQMVTHGAAPPRVPDVGGHG
jgi:hypothetical protein